MQPNKAILFTFDYEMFLLRLGTLENCIIKPVDELLKCCDSFGIKSTYFVDALYYMRLLESNETAEEAKLLKDQLQRLVSTGNRIELHLHPQWLDAKRNGKEWEFPTFRYYRLHDLPDEKVTDLFVSCVELLHSTAREVDPVYTVIAFRAGGQCVQPFEKLKQGFIKSGIKVDSTVAKGLKRNDGTHSYDFMDAPDSAIYRFLDDPAIEDKNGPFFEIPISSYIPSFISKITGTVTRLLHKDQFAIFGDGFGIPAHDSALKRLTSLHYPCTLDKIVPSKLTSMVRQIDQPIITLMSHPKLLTPFSLTALRRLHSQNHRFLTINEVLEESEQ
jgi:hypothetical protein